MSTARRSFLGSLVMVGFCLFLLATHEVGLRLLDRMGVVEQLLSPIGAESMLALLGGVIFIALRLTVVFVVPGAVLWSLLRSFDERRVVRKSEDVSEGTSEGRG